MAILNRKQYEKIKKMDHMQMNMWAESVYVSGFNDGKKATEGITSDELRDIIRGVKGIGEKRTEIIMKKVMEIIQAKQ